MLARQSPPDTFQSVAKVSNRHASADHNDLFLSHFKQIDFPTIDVQRRAQQCHQVSSRLSRCQ